MPELRLLSMKTRQLANNKYQIQQGSLSAIILLTARNGNYYFRPQGGTKKIATRTSNKEEAIAIAANHFFNVPESKSEDRDDVTIGELCERHWLATQRGEIENAKGKPIEFQHSKQIRWAAEKICGTKDLHKVYLSDFGIKDKGVSKPIADFRAKLFTDSQGRVIQQGEEYQQAAGSYNRFLRNFKALFKPELRETIYSDINLDDTAIACIRAVKLKKIEHKRFKAAEPEVLAKLDQHYSDPANFTQAINPRVSWNIYVRYWLARCCGLRKAEIINARHEWLINDNGQWFVNVTHTAKYREEEIWQDGWSSKSSNSRWVPIPQWLVEKIQANKLTQRKDEPIIHLIGYTVHHRADDEHYRKEWRKAVTLAGGDYRNYKKPTHHLRGEFITAVAHASGSVTTAQAYAGHSDPLTTSRHYYDASRVKNRIEINPLGQSLSHTAP